MTPAETPQRPIQILVIEDNPADVYLIQTALRDARILNEVYTVGDGEDALDFLHRRGKFADAPTPDIVFLDLSLPKVDGHNVLSEMKSDTRLRRIPVIVVSGSSAQSDVSRAYDGQVAGYLVKPTHHDEYFNAIRAVKEMWFHVVTLPSKGEAASSS